jgi:protein subunit release factor B
MSILLAMTKSGGNLARRREIFYHGRNEIASPFPEAPMPLQKHDLEITFFKSGGPGGQKKNKTETAVRIRHRPSGITVTATEQRSRHANMEKALERLHQRLAAARRRPRKRLPTRPGRAARERRLAGKKQRALVKQRRRPVAGD